MKIKYIVSMFVLASSISMSVLAMHHNGPCHSVAKACIAGGYSKMEGDKNIWNDCMKPVIMGKTVKGVSVDPAIVKNCRINKIDELKKELSELEKAS